jgi:hypothetical protein
LTATRSWKVSGESAAAPAASGAAFTRQLSGSTQTARPIGGTDVVYIELSHPDRSMPMRTPAITWRLDGKVVTEAANRVSFPLAPRRLTAGKHTLTVTLGEASGNSQGSDAETRTWTIDSTPPTVTYTLSTPVASIARADGSAHVFMRDEFTMRLDPVDDQPGYLVAEFRVNEDGWHHYYGWPDAPAGTPFKFTPRGTNIKELIYGSLSSEGLSPQPWESRAPGWGTHKIEYRAIDAAGNIGSAKTFRVTFMPGPACTANVAGPHTGELRVESGVTCVTGATISGDVTVAAGASLVATNARITGGVTASGAATIELVETSIGRDVRVSGSTDRVTLFGATISGEASLTNNKTSQPAGIIGNSITGPLACTGNSVAPANGGTPNTLKRGATGQCAGM